MYTLRLTVQDDDGSRPVKPVRISASCDDEAIKIGRERVADEIPANYTFLQARVLRGEEVIWSSN
jgi:hypothetical protein